MRSRKHNRLIAEMNDFLTRINECIKINTLLTPYGLNTRMNYELQKRIDFLRKEYSKKFDEIDELVKEEKNNENN